MSSHLVNINALIKRYKHNRVGGVREVNIKRGNKIHIYVHMYHQFIIFYSEKKAIEQWLIVKATSTTESKL